MTWVKGPLPAQWESQVLNDHMSMLNDLHDLSVAPIAETGPCPIKYLEDRFLFNFTFHKWIFLQNVLSGHFLKFLNVIRGLGLQCFVFLNAEPRGPMTIFTHLGGKGKLLMALLSHERTVGKKESGRNKSIC